MIINIIGNALTAPIPTLVKFKERVSFVNCGGDNTVIVTECGKLHVLGKTCASILNSFASLERNIIIANYSYNCIAVATEDDLLHTSYYTLSPKIKKFSCGSISLIECSYKGIVILTGNGDVDLLTPTLSVATNIVDMDYRRNHQAFIDKKGVLYTSGKGCSGELGDGDVIERYGLMIAKSIYL